MLSGQALIRLGLDCHAADQSLKFTSTFTILCVVLLGDGEVVKY